MGNQLFKLVAPACHRLGAPSPSRLLAWFRYDGFICGYPKVGNTWYQTMLRKALVLHFGLGDEWLPEILNRRSRLPRGVPAIEITHNIGETMRTWSQMAVETSFLRNRKLILLMRDPKDAIVSLFMHNKYRYRTPLYNGESANEMVHDEVFGIDRMLKYYRDMYKARRLVSDMQLVRYEDMHRSPHAVLTQSLALLGLSPVQPEHVEAAVEFASFDNMRRLEDTNGIKMKTLAPSENEAEPERSRKVRSGRVGGYHEHLEPEIVSYIDQRVRAELPVYFGYPAA